MAPKKSKNNGFAEKYPLISKMVKKDHADFMKSLSSQIEKIMADYVLYVNATLSKIKAIANLMKDEKVIDGFEVNEKNPFASVILIKKGTVSTLEILTNGKLIYIVRHSYTSSVFPSFNLDTDGFEESFDNCHSDNFDWLNFSKKLLTCVHSTIYEAKEARKVKMESFFKSS